MEEDSTFSDPGPSKRARVDLVSTATRKLDGAATYRSKFQRKWQLSWPCIAPVQNNPHSFECTLCKRTVSCGHMGEREVKRHIESAHHQKNLKSMKHIKPLSFPTLNSDKVAKYVMAEL